MNLCSGQLRVRNKVVAVGLERYDEKQIGRAVVFLMGRSVGFERLLS